MEKKGKLTKWRVNETKKHPWIVECETQIPEIFSEVASIGYKPYAELVSAAPDLLEALELFVQFFDEMPKGQFGKIVCDIGILNDAFIKSRRAIKKAEGKRE